MFFNFSNILFFDYRTNRIADEIPNETNTESTTPTTKTATNLARGINTKLDMIVVIIITRATETEAETDQDIEKMFQKMIFTAKVTIKLKKVKNWRETANPTEIETVKKKKTVLIKPDVKNEEKTGVEIIANRK